MSCLLVLQQVESPPSIPFNLLVEDRLTLRSRSLHLLATNIVDSRRDSAAYEGILVFNENRQNTDWYVGILSKDVNANFRRTS